MKAEILSDPLAFPDLRSFLRELARQDELVEIKRPVDPNIEMSAVINEARGKAVLFQHVIGSSVPVVGNVFGNWRKVEIALGARGRNLLPLFNQRMQNLIPPRLVETGPVKDRILLGDAMDLWQLPLPKVNELDGGRYIDGGVIISRDPEYGYNLSLQRLQVKRSRQSCILAHSNDMGEYIRRAEKRGEPLEIAVAIGVDPALHMASQSARGQIQLDEYEIAGAIRGGPIDVVLGETVNLHVPALAEIILEGVIRPGRREAEGPFGEFTGYYTSLEENQCPVIEYTAMTTRKDPFYQTIYLGRPQANPPAQEGVFMTALPKAYSVYRIISNLADVSDVYFPPGGCGMFHCVVAIKKRRNDDGKLVMKAVLERPGPVKFLIVVDDDIDVRNPHEVEWAMATRSQCDVDTITSSGFTPLDPSVLKHSDKKSSKFAIDATRPLGINFPPEVRIPEEVTMKVRNHWLEYLAGANEKIIL